MVRAPLGRLEELGSGRVRKVMDTDVEKTSEFIAHSLPELVASFTAPLAVLVLLFVFDRRLGVASVACIAVAYGVQMSGSFNKRMRDTMPRYMAVQESMANATVEYVRGMPVVKAFGQSTSSFSQLSDSIKEYTGLAVRVAPFWQNLMPLFTAIVNNAYLFILPVGIILGTGVDDWPPLALSFIFYILFVPSIGRRAQQTDARLAGRREPHRPRCGSGPVGTSGAPSQPVS
ncbi:ABC transporter transmembrane domain-containing protein [uncultured Propionibacterium sp.]|uniref:ABC transporter transmembrane domain-containing protein n=1 Tax=uncultured Propionibacterium sp. TaxID=218066 RepID=UPI00292F0845|nr:ABC transporter transmembrane domain-containing protein [uncultured Propionibacterium sp.]